MFGKLVIHQIAALFIIKLPDGVCNGDWWQRLWIINGYASKKFGAIVFACWIIWKFRNNKLFIYEPIHTNIAFQWSCFKIEEFYKVKKSFTKSPHSGNYGWTPPLEGFVQYNSDGSSSNMGISIGITLRASNSYYILGFAEKRRQGSNNLAEFLGLRTALEHTVQSKLTKTIFQVVSKFVFGAITHVNGVSWQYISMVNDCAYLIRGKDFHIQLIKREANKGADFLAKLALKKNIVQGRWCRIIPHDLSLILYHDKIVSLYPSGVKL